MHCWAAQWAGQKQVLSDRQTSDEAVDKDDARIVDSLATLVRKADVVIAHNADRFDVPRLRGRLIVNDQETLGPVATIDTLKIARKLGFAHNNLDSLAKELGLGGKVENPPHLWDAAYEGSETALKQMVRYCKHDVALLAQLFERLRPHATQLRRLVDGDGVFCPYCGSTSYQKRGKVRTQASTTQKYQCQECDRYFKDKTGDAAKRQMRPA
jgi:DNA polymerase III epsilon subunit-like protein